MFSLEKSVNGKTKLIALIGNPVEHTLSPLIHNTLSQFVGNNLIYVPFCPKPSELERAFCGLQALQVVGCNITIPYKTDVVKYIDVVSDDAKLMDAVNTVRFINDRSYGYNTDSLGFLKAIQQKANIPLRNKNVVILGAGGTARSIAVTIAKEGASSISIVNRTLSHATHVAEVINANIAPVAKSYTSDEKGVEELFTRADLIVNTTSVGMHPYLDEIPIQSDWILPHHCIFDVIYSPAKTKLLRTAEKKGSLAINGLGMLVYQAIGAYEIWTEKNIDDSIADKIYSAVEDYL